MIIEGNNGTQEGKQGAQGAEPKNNEPNGGNQEGHNTGGVENKEGKETEKVYSEKEMQAEIDRRVTEAIKKVTEKNEKAFADRLEKEKEEAAKLAKMSADERAAAEAKKAKEEFEAERKQYAKDKLEFEVTKALAEQKINPKFSKFITALGSEGKDENIKEFLGLLSEQRKSVIDEVSKGNPPKSGGGNEGKIDPFLKGFGL